MITYGYARVSTKEQNLERQITAIKAFRPDIPQVNIFMDKQSGTGFDRPQYNALKVIIEHLVNAGKQAEIIEIIFEELDRLGRTTEGIRKELTWFKEKGVCVRILEIPTTLIEISTENKWVMDLINQILIEVYAAMAQQELEKKAKRQVEGIAEAQKKGVKFGRPAVKVDEVQFEQIYQAWEAKEITAKEAMKVLNLKPNTFYRRLREYKEKK